MESPFATSMSRFLLLKLGLLVLWMVTGCSEMQFVGKPVADKEVDPREDIVLTNVETQMTSGGIVQQRIAGANAVYSEKQNELIIRGINVTSIGDKGDTQSITRADVGQIYFEDKPEIDVGRKDIKFAGNVLYRNPKVDDPTSDSLRMKSDLIIWDESAKKFISPQGYEMLLLPKGQQPIRQSGKSFEASQDLTRFVVKAGAVTTEMDYDPVKDREEMLANFESIRNEVEESANQKPDVPLTVILPEQ